MSELKQKLPGQSDKNGIEYRTKVPGNIPFCHLCRQRVEAVVVLQSDFSGNPLHVCRACLIERVRGFEELAESDAS